MQALPYDLSRTVHIQAPPETVFDFFTDSARWAAWWGAGSTIDPTPGGKVYIRHGNGVEVLGEVLSIDPPRQIVFTYGYASGNPIPPGASRVTITLSSVREGTRLELHHEFAEAAPRDLHVQGWRYQLSLFANAVANRHFADAAASVDAWFAVWTMADEAARNAELARIADPAIRFRNHYSHLEGYEDVSAHIAAALRFMPGVALARTGDVRHCQGAVLVDWSAGQTSGASVFQFAPDRRIVSVISFANPQ